MTRLMISVALFAWSASSFAQGVISSLAQLDRIQPGVTTAQEVRQLLGAPTRTMRFPARGIEAMEYDARDYTDRLVISIAIGSDGKVRDIQKLRQASP